MFRIIPSEPEDFRFMLPAERSRLFWRGALIGTFVDVWQKNAVYRAEKFGSLYTSKKRHGEAVEMEVVPFLKQWKSVTFFLDMVLSAVRRQFGDGFRYSGRVVRHY